MATESIRQSNGRNNEEIEEFATQISILKRLLPNVDFDVEVKSSDELHLILLNTIEYINKLNEVLHC